MLRKIIGDNRFVSSTLLYGAVLTTLGVVATLLMRYLTPFGMGLVNDSIAYIGGARSLIAGHGYSQLKGNWTYEPITHFPPFVSLVLVFLNLFGFEVLRGIRLLNILLFGGNVILTGVVLQKLTSRRIFGIIGSFLFLISAPMLTTHSFALSEPLYLFLNYLAFLSLFIYIMSEPSADHARWHLLWLVASGILTSLGYLTRYVGASLYATSLSFLFIFNRKWSNRIKDMLIFLASSVPGAAAWSLRNLMVTGNAANRPIFWHPIPTDKWYQGLMNFWGWLLPVFPGTSERILLLSGIILAGGLLLITIAVAVYVIRYWQGKATLNNRSSLTVLFALYAIIYLGLLIVAMNFFDDKTIFEHRMLAPFYVATLILIVAGLAWLWERPNTIGNIASIALLVTLLISFGRDGLDVSKMLHQSGQGYASGKWRNSETIEAVKQLPPVKIFSNKITALYILADRPGYVIPWRFTPPGEPDPSYEQGVKEYQRQVMNSEAYVVLFDYVEEVASGNERVIDIANGLPVLGMYNDGAIFGLPPE